MVLLANTLRAGFSPPPHQPPLDLEPFHQLNVFFGTNGGGESTPEERWDEAASGGAAEADVDRGEWLDMGSVYAAALQLACVLVVMGGLRASKFTVNIFCVAKVGCVFYCGVRLVLFFSLSSCSRG